jgi:hypothetical protein
MYAAGGEFQVQVRLNLTDGTHFILAVVDTELLGLGDVYDEGNLLQVELWTQCPYTRDGTDEVHVGMLLASAKVIGTAPCPEQHIAPCAASSDWGLPPEAKAARAASAAAAARAAAATAAAGDDDGAGDDDSEDDDGNGGGDGGGGGGGGGGGAGGGGDGYPCDGSLCSICGLRTNVCFSALIAMPDLEHIRSNCYFADRLVSEMTNAQKRNMLYWWLAVNVFAICGKGMRQPLPACIIAWIRKTHPNPRGEPYKGFEPSA